MSGGKYPFSPLTQPWLPMPSSASKDTRCPRAWTPASVRLAPRSDATPGRIFWTASSRAPATVGAFFCGAQPAYLVPS